MPVPVPYGTIQPMISKEDSPASQVCTYIAAVQIKLPPFWSKDPKLCFAQIESQFAIRQITVSRTKFDHVVSLISPEFSTEYETCFSTPPNDTPDI